MICSARVALVTGASSGIGRSIALTLAREGASVAVNYLEHEKEAEAVAGRILSRGGRAITVRADVFESSGCRGLVDATVAGLGPVDICVINPGGGWHPGSIAELDSEAALEDIRRETAPLLHLMPLVLPGMFEREWGRIVGITVHPTELPPAYSYNTAKGARSKALDLAWGQAWKRRVTVNALAPGPVAGIATLEEAIVQCDHGDTWLDRGSVTPQDVAEGVIFLCSEAGRFITGCELPYLHT